MAEINDQDRAKSAAKLGITKYLPVIDSIPDPARQASAGAKNVQSDAAAEAFRVGSTGVQLPPEQVVANPGLPDSITAAHPPAPVQDPLIPAGSLAFLDDVPNAPAPTDVHEPSGSGSFLDDIPDVQTPIQAAHAAVSMTDADHNAQVAKLSKHFGQPPEFIDKNIAVANKAAAAPSPSFFQNMENQYPGSTKFYSDPKNMAVAHDDMPNVVATEDAVQKVTQAHSVLDELKAKWQHTLLGLMTGGKPTMTEDPNAPMWEKLSTGLPTLAAGDLPFMLAGGFAGAVGGEAVGGPPGAFLGSAAGGFGAPAAVKKGLEEAYDKGGIKNYTDLKNITEDSLKEFVKQTGVGLAVQATGGATAAATGALGAGVVTSTAAKLATEAGALEVAGKGVEGQKPSLDGYIENLATVGALHAVLPGHSAPLEAQKTQAAKDFYTSLGDTAEASKLRERMPEAHQALIKDLTKDSPVQNIFLPVDAATSYFQSKGLDIGTVADQLGIRPAYDEAKATGSDIKIPLDTWVSRVVGTEHYKGLENDIKFHPDDLSVNQTTQRQADIQAQVQAAATDAGNTAPLPLTDDKLQAVEAAGKVYQDLKAKLEAAGLSANEVQYDPKLHEAFFSTIAKRINESLPADSQIDPYELQQRFPLEVRKFNSPEDRNAAGKSFNQPQPEESPAPPFFSKLTNTVEEKMGGSATPEQIQGMLKESKPEERKWLGVDEFLKGKKKVSKQEMLDHLRGNALEIKEITKGDHSTAIKELPSYQDYIRDMKNEGHDTDSAEELAHGMAMGKHGGASEPDSAKSLRKEFTDKFGYERPDPKYENYTLPGGKNYREMLFQLPKQIPEAPPNFETWSAKEHGLSKEESAAAFKEKGKLYKEYQKLNMAPLEARNDQFRHSHFGEENVLAHTRLNDRVDSEGKKILLAEEIQSDWHQEGRKKGYKEGPPVSREDAKQQIDDYAAELIKKHEGEIPKEKLRDLKDLGFNVGLSDIDKFVSPEEREEYARLARQFNDSHGTSGKVPDAPFRKNWHEFVLKRLIREAAEKGYDKLAWTTGEQQAERYDLSKKIDDLRLLHDKETGNHTLYAHDLDGNTVLEEVLGPDPGKAEDFIGKEAYKKLSEQEPKDLNSEFAEQRLAGADLKVGGEGMKGFYDKILPDFANKFGKKYGAKVSESEIPSFTKVKDYALEQSPQTDRWYVVDQSGDGGVVEESMEGFGSEKSAQRLLDKLATSESVKVHSLEITPELRKAAIDEGFSLFQGGKETPRGQITINGRNFNIDLFKNKDKSTFLHESGHFFLEVMGHVVEGEGKGSESIKADYASVLKFLGVSDRGEIGPDQHEKFARAFEEYLSTGEAPSEGLRDAFVRFRQWLTDLWKKVSFAKVEVSPEIKAVFDRMLSADDEIKQAKRSMNMEEEFKVDGLDEETGKKIKTLQDRARARAEETLLKEKMKEVTPEFREKLAAEREKARATAEEQVKQESVFRAMEDLKEITKDPYKLVQSNLLGETTPAENAHMEAVAEQNGFLSAEDMSKQIHLAGVNGEFDSKVKAATDENLRQSGILKDHAQTREEAIRAIHSENMTELLALEREALADLAAKKEVTGEVRRKNRIIAKVEAAAANAEAERILNSKPASEAGRPQLYITQERNAAARVAKFLANKDFEKAAAAKQQQMVAHALVRESFKISEEQAKHISYIDRFTKRGGSLLDMPYGFVRQVDQLLSRFKFQDERGEDTKTLSAIATKMMSEGKGEDDIANATGLIENEKGQFVPESFAQFVDRQNEYYYDMLFPSDVMTAAGRDYKDFSITELRDLRQSVQTLVELGRKHGRFTNEFIKIDIKEAAAKLKASIEENYGKKYAADYLPGKADVSKAAELMTTLSRLPDTLARTLDTILTTCHKFDGQEEGPAKEFIYRPFADAESRKIVRTKQAMEETDAIFAKHYKDGEFAKYKDEPVMVNGRKFTKEQILSMALNWGNEGNRDRLLRGFNYDQSTVREAFRNLKANDWGFVQDTWDHIDKYWPEIAKLEMDVNGVEPGKVEPTPFTNEHGKFAGGYYPISYDFEKSAEAFQNNQSKDALFKQYSSAKASTAQGHAQARVTQVRRMLRLSLDVLTNHHEDVIHDLEFRKAVIDTSRFLRENDAKTGIVNAVGIKGYAAFNDWLKSVAGGSSEPLTTWDKAAQWFRFKTTFFNLGYRIASAPKIALENINNISSELGVTGAARSLINYYTSGGMHDLVTEKSAFMKQRGEHLDRDMGDIVEKNRGEQGITASFRAYAFYVHAFIDQCTSFPVWADTYKRGMADHGEEKLSVSQADEAVKRTFMSGGAVDQAGAMRGSEVKKAMTTAYGYQSMMWNRFSLANHAAGMAWNDGSPIKAAAIMARTAVYTFAMPAIITALTREFVRNGPPNSNQQDREKRMAASMIEESTPLKFIPVVRDMQSYAVRKALGEHVSGLHFTPLDEAAQTLIDPLAEALGKHSGKFGEHAANAVSLATGFPKELDDIVFNHIDWMQNHGAWNWLDAVTRKSKK